MGHGPNYKMPLRRRREGKTDYRSRLHLVKSGKTRAVVRISNKNIKIQFVRYVAQGDEIIITVTSNDLCDHGWSGSRANIPSAYLTGYLAGKRALEEGIEDAILDIGMLKPHPGGKVFSTMKGMVEAGLDIPHNPSILPEDGRIAGEHIDESLADEFNKVKNKLEEL